METTVDFGDGEYVVFDPDALTVSRTINGKTSVKTCADRAEFDKILGFTKRAAANARRVTATMSTGSSSTQKVHKRTYASGGNGYVCEPTKGGRDVRVSDNWEDVTCKLCLVAKPTR